MTSHPTLRSWPRRSLSVGLASALALGALGLVAPAAQADEPVAAPVLRWLVSEQFRDSISVHTFADGATEDADKVVTFPNGSGSYNPNGAASISYAGSVTAAFVNGGNQFYRVTIAEPRIVVDSDGEGVLSAVVSAWSVAQGANPEASTDPKRVIVTTFDAAPDDWSEGSARRTLTATPDWIGVLPAGSQQALDLGITAADRPVDDASFAPSFLAQLTPAIRAHFYLTGAQPKKKPATVFAEADPIQVAATPTTSGTGVSVAVSGTGFSGQSLAGDAGVYVGIAPSGGLPDVSSPAAVANFAGAQYVPVVTGGALSVTVTAPADKLDPAKTYSVYTWQAHTHSTRSQDTETPFAIDFAAFQPAEPTATTTTLKVVKKTYGSAALTATVSAGSGTVALSGSGVKTQTKQLVNGAATFTLPDNLTVKKSYTLTASYSGNATHRASTSKPVKLTVTKGGVAGTFSVSAKPTSKKRGKGTVTVQGAAAAKAPGGTAYVKFTKGKSSKSVKVKLSGGKKTITIPKLKKGTWKISVKYQGDSRYGARAYHKVGTVKVTK